MNDLPRQKLAEILQKYGPLICDEPSRLKGFLLDFCGQYRKEVNVLIAALQERVPGDLLSSQNSVRSALLIPQLVRRLQDNLGLDEQAARWSVESWALALGVISPADLKPPTSSPEPLPLQSPPLPPRAVEPSAERPPIVPPPYRQENVFAPPPAPTPPPIAVNPAVNPATPDPLVNPPAKYAGFWQRFVATAIDWTIGFLIWLVVSVIFFGSNPDASVWLFLPIAWLYDVLQESSQYQATIGKRIMHIRVTDLQKRRISFGQATGRFLGKFLSYAIGLGFLMATFTEKKQALHDLISGCLVINKS